MILTLDKYDFIGHKEFQPPVKIHICLSLMCCFLAGCCKSEGKKGEKGKELVLVFILGLVFFVIFGGVFFGSSLLRLP